MWIGYFRYMLGLTLYNIAHTCPSCNTALLDIYGDHNLTCGFGSEHTRMSEILYII